MSRYRCDRGQCCFVPLRCPRTSRQRLYSEATLRLLVGRARESVLDDHGGVLGLGQREAVSLALRSVEKPPYRKNVSNVVDS